MARRHDERCKDCKKVVEHFLSMIYGSVIPNHDLSLPSRLADYSGSVVFDALSEIHLKLQRHRNYVDFVRSKKLKPVDFFVPAYNLIVEFDESQHFSELRKITLENYPDSLKIGYDKSKWMKLCQKLNKKDPDPKCIFRDEQRAWFDTLRDFAPIICDLKPTIRLYASEYPWCSLNIDSPEDINTFLKLIGEGKMISESIGSEHIRAANAGSVKGIQEKINLKDNTLNTTRKSNVQSGAKLKVARAWMNMGVSRSEFTANNDSKWLTHKHLVINQFNNNPNAYVERVNNIFTKAEHLGVDAVLLPACVLVHDSATPITAYRLPKQCVVVAGALEIINTAGELREHAIAGRNGKALDEFDNKRVYRFDGGKFTALAAISSTIKHLHDKPDEEPIDLSSVSICKDLPIVLFDSGHHPYSDYYRRHTMRIAAEVLVKRYSQKAAVVLSSWQYITSKPAPTWCMPNEVSTLKQRIADGCDILDLIEISFP